MVSKLDWQTYTSEFESHWVPHSYGLVPHLSKKLSKLLQYLQLQRGHPSKYWAGSSLLNVIYQALISLAQRPQVAYSTCCCWSGHPSKYWTGSSLLNFGAFRVTWSQVSISSLKLRRKNSKYENWKWLLKKTKWWPVYQSSNDNWKIKLDFRLDRNMSGKKNSFEFNACSGARQI